MLTNLTPNQLNERINDQTVLLVDVRNPIEYGLERIAGAVNAPLVTFDPNSIPRAVAHAVVFQCGSGARSAAAAKLFSGLFEVTPAHLEGGLGAWKAAGLPTDAIDPMTGNITVSTEMTA